jgi:hypothetical protein
MPLDLRKYTDSTNKRLVIGGVVLLLVVGVGLIAWIYGFQAALLGALCMLGGLTLVGLVALLMYLIGVILKKNNRIE